MKAVLVVSVPVMDMLDDSRVLQAILSLQHAVAKLNIVTAFPGLVPLPEDATGYKLKMEPLYDEQKQEATVGTDGVQAVQ